MLVGKDEELCAKVERDRENGRRTIGGIHQAMLKQVATISDTKIPAICEHHPTLTTLLEAYEETGRDGRTLLQCVSLQSAGGGKMAAAGNRTLGARSAAELYVVYGLPGYDDDSGEQSDPASTPKYTELVRMALNNQKVQAKAATADDDEYNPRQASEVILHSSVSHVAATTRALCSSDEQEPVLESAMPNQDGRSNETALGSSDGDNGTSALPYGRPGTKKREVIEID